MSDKRDEQLPGQMNDELGTQDAGASERVPAHPLMRGDEPPELTNEDEEILDRIWA